MQKDLDGWDIAAQVRFMRQTHKGSFLLVEGRWDNQVLSRFVDESECSIEVAFGKKNALQALDLLEEDGFEGVVAVVDADFDRLDRIVHNLDGIFLTDRHDLDLTIILSKAINTYLAFRVDQGKYREAVDLDSKKVTDKVLDAAKPLGCCRWISSTMEWMLKFQDLSFDFINQTDLSCDDSAMVAEILAQSPSAKCSETQLLSKLQTMKSVEVDVGQLVCGHDAAAILGIALRQYLASRPKAQTWRREIEAGLRLAFDLEAFSGTELFNILRVWEQRHRKFKLLKT